MKKADSEMNMLVTDRRRNSEPQRRTDRHCIEPSRENVGSKSQIKIGFRVFERNNIQGN